MLQWFRAHSRSIAATTLLSLIALTAWSAGPHPDDCHEAICAAAVPHDASAHSVGRDTSSTDRPLHCVLCHWTRIVRPLDTAAHHVSPAVDSTVRFRIDPSMRPRRSSPRSPASRPAVFSSSRRVSRVPSPERETPVCRLGDWFMHFGLLSACAVPRWSWRCRLIPPLKSARSCPGV